MLRIFPYLLIWMGFWLIYFPVVDLNPVENNAKIETLALTASAEVGHVSFSVFGSFFPAKNIFSSLFGTTFIVGQAQWKPLFWGSGISMFLLALLLLYWEKKSKLISERQTLLKIRQLEQAALRAQMSPHFIFNSLNSIQSFIVDGDKKSSVHYLAKFSRLVRSTMHFSNAQKITLEQELDMLRHYLELEKLRFKGAFDFNINVHPSLDPIRVFLPPMLIQPFIENSVIHGIGPLGKKGQVTVDIEPQDDALIVTVTDNGIGITASKKGKERDRPRHKPIGMKVTKKRLRLLSPDQNIQKLKVKELMSKEGEVIGMEVQVKIADCQM